MFQIVFPSTSVEKRFQKAFSKLDADLRTRVQEALLSLQDNPRPQGKVWKNLNPPVEVGQFVASCRIRVGHLRILYDVDDQREKVVLLALRNRNEGTY